MKIIRQLIVFAAVVLFCILATPSNAVIEAVEFDSPQLQERYQSLIAELRCTVCQNQNLADSDAELAKDLRRKTEEMLKAGLSDQQILSYMRDRYGDFVLYRPPLNSTTSLLWIGPFILLMLAVGGILITVKRKQTKQSKSEGEAIDSLEIDQTKLAKVRDLLND
ncbi:MAG: cytochrome c-type biogenesis protein CcmH [Acidiferrobacterales bacterium]|nr:cytochrome c-type biogenesis protein CcmH [Acidiferrobacterales bacterium]